MTLSPAGFMESLALVPDALLAAVGVIVAAAFGYAGVQLKARVEAQGQESRLEWDRTTATLERQDQELQALRDMLGAVRKDLTEVRGERDDLRQDVQDLRGELRDRDEVLADVAAYLPVLTAWALEHGAPPPPPSPTWRLRDYLDSFQITRFSPPPPHTEGPQT